MLQSGKISASLPASPPQSLCPSDSRSRFQPQVSVPSLCSSPSPHTLELSDGQILTDIDAVIFATGYQGTPINTLLGPAILARITPRDGPQGRPEEGFTRLYKEVMVPELPEMALSVQGYAAGQSPRMSAFSRGFTQSADLRSLPSC